MELADVAAPKAIWSTNDREAFELERSVEKADAREEAENEGAHACPRSNEEAHGSDRLDPFFGSER